MLHLPPLLDGKLLRPGFDLALADAVTIDSNKKKVTPQASVAGAAFLASSYYKNRGKHYFEWTVSHTGANGDAVGIAAFGTGKTQLDLTTPTGCCVAQALSNLYGERRLFNALFGTRANGDVVGVHVDLDNWRVWFRLVWPTVGSFNGNASANPSDNIGGIDISSYAESVVAPVASFKSSSQVGGGLGQINLGQDPFFGVVAPGYNRGWSAQGDNASSGGFTALNTGTAAQAAFDPGNLLVAHTSATLGGAVANDFKTTGKFYFEERIVASGSNGDAFGLMNAAATFTNFITNGSNCFAVYLGTGAIWSNGANSTKTLGARATGDVLGFAIDFGNQRAWVRVAPSGNWNNDATADPATNTGGISISTVIGSGMVPALGFNNSTLSIFALNPGRTKFLGSVPAGFTAGWPVN
jgi:hypothetical protein